MRLYRKKTGETLLCAGGQWDRIEARYTGRQPDQVREIKIIESQVPFLRWYSGELAAMAQGFPRDTSLGLCLGDRRAGKTVGALGAGVATNIEVPQIGWHGFLTWVVGVTRPEMKELDRYLRWLLPAAWYQYKAQEHLYQLLVGSEIHSITADDPRTLKRGEANLVIVNEGQKMPIAVLSNAIMGTVDHDGLALIAANQPEDIRGAWIAKIARGVKQGTIPATVLFPMSSKDNDEIDQGARGRAAGILQVLDPQAYQVDVLNQDILQEGKALPHFDPQIHVRPRPQVGYLIDITADVTYRRIGRPYQFVLGQDYQGSAYMPAVPYKVFGSKELQACLRGDLDRSQLDPERDLPHYWIVGEVITRKGATEHELCDEMWIAGYRPETAYCVGDASGSWQNSEHRIGDDSFTIIRSRRWHVVPPFEQRTDRVDAKPLNPKRPYRIGLARLLMGLPPEEVERRRKLTGVPERVVAPRWFIEPQCKFGITALQEAELKPTKGSKELAPFGYYGHYFDGATYPLCHLEPRPEEQAPPGELPDHLEQIMQELKRRRQAPPL